MDILCKYLVYDDNPHSPHTLAGRYVSLRFAFLFISSPEEILRMAMR